MAPLTEDEVEARRSRRNQALYVVVVSVVVFLALFVTWLGGM